MKHSLLWYLMVCSFFLNAQENQHSGSLLNPRIAEREISVGGAEADIRGYTNESIQYAIDALERSGGTVFLNPGVYRIVAPVRMKSNVRLTGSGTETILKKAEGVQTPYIIDADYGELKVTVANPEGFETGMKIQVTDSMNRTCWNVSTAYITAIQDNVIYIDKGLIRDYRSHLNGKLSNASSVIEVIQAENAGISNLVIDGNRKANYFADGCNSAGILIFRSKHITVDQVQVKDFNGEGISWQITEHVSVKNCEVSGCGNTGLHPGTGSPYSLIENNEVHHNDLDGLFICWRVYQSRISGNSFHHNGRYGICTGHKDTDVIFKNNHVYENANDGIRLRREKASNAPHRNTFEGNVIENNGTGAGKYGFSVNAPAEELVLRNNLFKNSMKTQKAAVYIHKNGREPVMENNRFDAHELGEVVSEEN